MISGNPHAIHLLHPAASGLRRLTEVELRKKCRWPIWNRRMLLPLVYGGSKSLRRRHISLYVADGRISQGCRAHQQAFCKTCCMQLAVAIYSGLFRHISMSSKYNQTVCLEWSIAVEYWQQVHSEINRLYLHLLSHPVTIHPSGRCLEAIAAPNHKRNGHGEHGEQHHLRRLQEIHGPIMVRSCPVSESPSYFVLPVLLHQKVLTTSHNHSHLGVRSITSLTRTHDKKMEHIAVFQSRGTGEIPQPFQAPHE